MSINSSDRDRLTLEKELSNLLDYEDAADEIPEILDNLLISFFPSDGNKKIQVKNPNDSSKEDLLEHMVAWLGNGGGAVRSFVDNVVSFKRGGSITASTNGLEDKKGGKTDSNSNSNSNSNFNTQQSAGSQGNANAQVRSNRQKQQDRNLQKQKEAAHKKEELRKAQQKQQQQEQQQKLKLKRLEEEKQEREEQIIIQQKQQQQIQQQQQQQQQKQQQQRQKEAEAFALATKRKIQKEKDSKPPPPQTGKATVICGCFGTRCKPLTNCLRCGRISCEKEGYGYCPHCSHTVLTIDATLRGGGAPGDDSMERAILHKERLLRFDRECAERTVVLDDQADYFKNSSSTWLSGDERQEAVEEDDRLRKELHERKKPVMKLDILG